MSILRDYRSTFQLAGVYAAAGWLAFEIIDEVAARLGMPDAVSTAALVLLLIGLPVVVLTSYVQTAAARRSRMLEAHDRDLDPTLHPELAPARPAPASRLAAVLTWRRAALAGVVMFSLLGLGATGFMTAGHFGVGPLGTLFAQGVLSAEDPILMADFTSERDPALGRTVAEALRIDLVQSGAIRVADATFVQDALQRMQRDAAGGLTADVARVLAEREGLKAFIRGDVSVLGGGYQIATELVAADGAVLQAFRETARDSTELIDAVDRMSNRMRARIGESLSSIRSSEPLSRVTTASVPALRKYSEALQVTRSTGDQLAALALFEQAVALDSTFAMAWLAVGIGLSNMGLRQDDMLTAFRRAWSLRERMPEREQWRATASYETHVSGDERAAVDAYRNLLALEPSNMPARNNLASVLRRLRRNDEAEALLLPVPPESRSGTEWLNLAHAQYDQGRIEAAQAAIEQMKLHRPDHLNLLGLELGYATATGDYAQAERVLAEAPSKYAQNASTRYVASFNRAYLHGLRGEVRAAVRLLNETKEYAQRFDLVELQLAVELQAAAATALVLDDGARALQMVDTALRRNDRSRSPPQAQGHMIIALVAAAAGDAARARAELAAYEQLVPAEDRRTQQSALDATRASIALYGGRPDAALPVLRRLSEEAACVICALPELGRAYEMLGQPDSAIAVYTRYLETPSLARFGSDALWRAAVLFRLGDLHEAAGSRDAALRYYAEFIDLWQSADAELQPRVEAARRRVTALRSAG
jgi:tetratricopeptide (TPR) repeat protein